MRRQVEQLAIIGDVLIVDFAQHRPLHAIVEDLRRYPAGRLKGRDMTAQNGFVTETGVGNRSVSDSMMAWTARKLS
jgi:hypothetical protein